jgi:hypothetical protein
MPMGSSLLGLRTRDPPLGPIDMSGNFTVHVSAQFWNPRTTFEMFKKKFQNSKGRGPKNKQKIVGIFQLEGGDSPRGQFPKNK